MKTFLLLFASIAAAQPILVRERCLPCHVQAKHIGFIPISDAAMADGAFRDGGFRSPERMLQAHPQRIFPQLRAWLASGAPHDDEHRIDVDGVPVDQNGFWLSCRVPRNGQDIGLRVKIVDEAAGKVVAYDWPTAARDLNGRWNQWKIEVPKGSMRLPGKVTVQLHVSTLGDERELDGVLFLIEPKRTPDDDLRKQKDLKTIGMPDPPPHQNMTFRYVLRTPSDVTLLVRPEGGGPVLFRRTDRDLPAGQVLQAAWDLKTAPALQTGWYTARFQCNSRNPGVFQPDMAILFRIMR